MSTVLMSLHGMNVATTCLVAGVSYLALVRSLRWRRYNIIHEKYGTKIQSLTTEEAQEVMAVAFCYDMPFLLYYSIAFALLRTFAVVCIILLFNTFDGSRHMDGGCQLSLLQHDFSSQQEK
jgi:hypothetical protein